ncbi:C40 family peptidase, partial [Streptomyces sp. SID8455]|nr:C40 family peptidase [Streptomyces sp. SID8455]
ARVLLRRNVARPYGSSALRSPSGTSANSSGIRVPTIPPELRGLLRSLERGGTGSASVEGVKGKARTVLEAALSQRGVPYSWGGGDAEGKSTGSCCSPSGKSGVSIVGFDCSGLTTYAFARAGIRLPRTASAQSQRGKRLRTLEQMAPGDLVFFSYIPGQDSAIYHVGIYLGDGKMINAARPGTRVRIDPVASMSGFAGGARLW